MPAKRHRVTRGEDYRWIVRNGIRIKGTFFITHAVIHSSHDASAPARFGFIVSQAVGNAVTRNLVRRRLKALVERKIANGFVGADIVFRALPSSATATFAALQDEMDRSLNKAHLRFSETISSGEHA